MILAQNQVVNMKLQIQSSASSIGNNIFEGCKSLTNVAFETHSSSKTVGDFAFKNWTSLVQYF